MVKTNAMRLLEQAGIPFRTAEYGFNEEDLHGMHAAEGIGMPPEQVFKTLVTRDDEGQIRVYCLPVSEELDLKKAARASGVKSIRMIAVKELLPLTGYVRGGCSPVGMKKRYPVILDDTALLHGEIAVSAGQRGVQLILSPQALMDYIGAGTDDLTMV